MRFSTNTRKPPSVRVTSCSHFLHVYFFIYAGYICFLAKRSNAPRFYSLVLGVDVIHKVFEIDGARAKLQIWYEKLEHC